MTYSQSAKEHSSQTGGKHLRMNNTALAVEGTQPPDIQACSETTGDQGDGKEKTCFCHKYKSWTEK